MFLIILEINFNNNETLTEILHLKSFSSFPYLTENFTKLSVQAESSKDISCRKD